MIINRMVGGGGGLELTYTYTVATSLANLPASPDYTFGLITSVSVPANGLYIGAKLPASPSQGEVVIFTGNEGLANFEAIVDSKLYIAPITVYQYQTGIWVNITAYVRIASAWVNILVYFFNYGLISGYTWDGWTYAQGSQATGSTYLRMSLGAGGTGGAAGRRLDQPIDLSPYTTLTIQYNYSRSATEGIMTAALYVHTVKTTTDRAVLPTNSAYGTCSTGTGKFKTLDISGLNGSYYIQLYLGKSTYYETATFDVFQVSLI